ncbi:putative cfem domain-containing protein [Phaeoacremonium minimum UCRPA7]|uniref:Putative cfem domain-containing protein n=1 Tax=Phaeoacremonium minimum (strain UCR-PA7) TaxID=1286976 RepID=R8BUU9_PHAM7|nr:putative cfem domain-containing protein [Phaeoacremonium minimum UCRPA7]EOO03146.1 putative cfem domain-containing protein [Phaeoacremonium minimum UCRPA7]
MLSKNVTATACDAPIRDKSQYCKTVGIALGVISAVVVVLRLAFKLFVVKSGLKLDDWFILATLVVGIPGTVILVVGTIGNGLGRDIWTLPFHQISVFVKFFFVMEVQYFIDIALLKLSLLFFYLNIFQFSKVRKFLWITIAIVVLWGITFVIVAFVQCSPLSFYWTNWDHAHKGTCLNINAIGWANAAISIALDLWMLAIPLSQLPALNLHWKKKIGVALMFCVGTFVTVVSILRLQSLVHFANSLNPTWDNFDVSLWSATELNVGIICACMPSLRLMLVRLFPTLGSSATRGGQYDYRNQYGSAQSRGRNLGQSINTSAHVTSRHDRNESNDGNPEWPGARGGIHYQRSFNVQYGESENDEARLVEMNDLYGKAGSKAMSSASEVSG